MRIILLKVVILLLCSCSTKNVKISVEPLGPMKDSIIIKDLITEKPIVVFSTCDKEIEFTINEPTIVSIESQNDPQRFSLLSILYNGKSFGIQRNPNNDLSSTNLADSLLQYLSSSNNSFIQENQNRIFSSSNPLDVLNLFDHFLNERDSVIKIYRNRLSSIETSLLNYQNHARIYSFLFYYGRIIQNLEPQNTYWSFISKIDNNNKANKLLPHNLLYKYEIEYLKKYNTIESLQDFIAFIQENTTNKDLAEFLKAIYIKELISSPDYWQKHNQLFNSITMNEVLEAEENNSYKDIYSSKAQHHFASQQGMTAYNFSGLAINNKTLKLTDFLGKYVMIDVWATWCGACINQKPLFYELADKFQDSDDIQFITVSVDSSIESWQHYLSKDNNSKNVIDLIIKDGLKTEFGEQYSLNFIPKYILIDKDGKIIDANTYKPSQKLENKLRTLLSNN